jgi:S-DNA-T family DNA segregation ATPase FtsK/SpoIIIE
MSSAPLLFFMRRKKYKRGGYNYKPVELHPAAKKGIFMILLLGVGALAILSFFGAAGEVGRIFDNALSVIFGKLYLIFGLSLLVLSVLIYLGRGISILTYLGYALFLLSVGGFYHLLEFHKTDLFSAAQLGQGGGYAGFALSFPLLKYAGFGGAILSFLILISVSVILLFNGSLGTLYKIFQFLISLVNKFFAILVALAAIVRDASFKPFEKKEVPDDDAPEEEQPEEEVAEAAPAATQEIAEAQPAGTETTFTERKPKRRPRIEIPLELLGKKTGKAMAGDVKLNMEVIKKTFGDFGIDTEMGAYSVGPTVTQYTMKPADGVRLSRITALSNDLALSLAAHPIRIEAPIPGKSLVGIEVPNKTIAIVNLRDLLNSAEFKNRETNTVIAVGEDVAGKSWVADLARMPHLLVAGSTGSGKSVCLNGIILSLLYSNGPDDLKLILVDPKRVEFPIYNGIPHLITPVITDTKKTINSLKWAIGEMDRRFDVLAKVSKRDIKSYNAGAKEKLPYIVIIVDELADLMASAGAEIEACIIRLAQMSRAVGIHLILATQRPSVDVITGLIKANITSRIAFSVGSVIDSRTILDTSGAEKLLGRGDMLFMTAELSKPKRLQCAYVSEDDAKRVTEFLKENYDKPEYNEQVTEKQKVQIQIGGNGMTIDSDDSDALIEDAMEIIMSAGKASASLLQRRLSVGYARAARILDILEQQGIISPADGAKPREVLVKKEAWATDRADRIIEAAETVVVEAEMPTEDAPPEFTENDFAEEEEEDNNDELRIKNYE